MPETFEEALGSSVPIDLTNVNDLPTDNSLVMAYDGATGRRAFRFILAETGVPLTQPVMDWATPLGFDGPGCQGNEVCRVEGSLEAVDLFDPPTQTAGGEWIYNPKTHDSGVIQAALQQCGCETSGVVSCRLDFHVKLQLRKPDGSVVTQGVSFTFCDPCMDRDEAERRGA